MLSVYLLNFFTKEKNQSGFISYKKNINYTTMITIDVTILLRWALDY
jgi:hypothetical protein